MKEIEIDKIEEKQMEAMAENIRKEKEKLPNTAKEVFNPYKSILEYTLIMRERNILENK